MLSLPKDIVNIRTALHILSVSLSLTNFFLLVRGGIFRRFSQYIMKIENLTGRQGVGAAQRPLLRDNWSKETGAHSTAKPTGF
jgi:hypothetical protein